MTAAAHDISVHFVLSEGNAVDCHHARELIEDIPSEYLLTDKAYSTENIRALAAKINYSGWLFHWPPTILSSRYLIENCLMDFKRRRGLLHVIPKGQIYSPLRWTSAFRIYG